MANRESAHPTPLNRLFVLLRPERQDLIVAVIYSIAIGLLSLAVPVAAKALVNTIAFGTVLQPIAVLAIVVFAALLMATLLQVLRTWVVEMLQRRIFVKLAGDVADRLLRVRAEAFDRQHGPELVNRFLDVITVQKTLSSLLVDGLSVFMQTTVGLVLLAVYHPYLLAFDVVLVLMIIVVLFGLGRGAVRTSIAESHSKYAVAGWLEEVALHRTAFRSRHGDLYARQRTNELVEGYLQNRSSNFRILLRQSIGALLLQAAAISTLLGVGGWLVIRGELTLGQLIAAELVLTMIVGSLAKFDKSLESLYDLQAGMDKLGHLLDLPCERPTGEAVRAPSGPAPLTLRNVSFAYPGQPELFTTPTLALAPGERVAIHGRSGSGKSTLLDLLYGFRDPTSGSLELDGADYRELKLAALRSQVALVREVDVFPGTVLDNVRLGLDADPVEVRRVLDQAGVLEAVNRLSNGVHTELTTGGSPLAPSQARRLMVARALLSRPRLLLLDEVLDQIDDLQLRGKLITTLFAEDAPWTLVITTERPEIWPLCGRVFALRAGILQQETLDELATARGTAHA